MSEGGDDSERKMKTDCDRDEATGDTASPRDKKTKLLTTDGGDNSVPVSRARPLDLLVAGRTIQSLLLLLLPILGST